MVINKLEDSIEKIIEKLDGNFLELDYNSTSLIEA
jgi:hypothetical protein